MDFHRQTKRYLEEHKRHRHAARPSLPLMPAPFYDEFHELRLRADKFRRSEFLAIVALLLRKYLKEPTEQELHARAQALLLGGDPLILSDYERGIVHFYAPELAAKPKGKWQRPDMQRYTGIFRYLAQRWQEYAQATEHLENLEQMMGLEAPEVRAAAEEVEREFAADWEVLHDGAQWPYMRHDGWLVRL